MANYSKWFGVGGVAALVTAAQAAAMASMISPEFHYPDIAPQAEPEYQVPVVIRCPFICIRSTEKPLMTLEAFLEGHNTPQLPPIPQLTGCKLTVVTPPGFEASKPQKPDLGPVSAELNFLPRGSGYHGTFPPPQFPAQATRSGHCDVSYNVDAQGHTESVKAVSCSDQSFAEPSIRAVQN